MEALSWAFYSFSLDSTSQFEECHDIVMLFDTYSTSATLVGMGLHSYLKDKAIDEGQFYVFENVCETILKQLFFKAYDFVLTDTSQKY